MSLIAESAAQKARLSGAKASLRVRGRIVKVASNNEDDNDAELTALIDDMAMMSDPDRPAQAQNPVYTTIACLAGSVDDPRAVVSFVESKSEKAYAALEFLETAGDRIWWKWRCEAQRDAF